MATESTRKPSPEGAPQTCPECRGLGWVDNRCITPDHSHKCMYCDGKGFDALERPCYACQGTGLIEVRKVDRNPCPLCSGAGIYPVPASMAASEFAYRPGVKV